jgi:hypothetical protein
VSDARRFSFLRSLAQVRRTMRRKSSYEEIDGAFPYN